jgi:hypothetical protein
VCVNDATGALLTEHDLINEPEGKRLLWWSFAAFFLFLLGVVLPFTGISPLFIGASLYILAVHADGTHFLSRDPNKLPRVF